MSPESVGYTANDNPGYSYVSTQNRAGTAETQGITAEYHQQLTFLPRVIRGLSVYGSITRVSGEPKPVQEAQNFAPVRSAEQATNAAE